MTQLPNDRAAGSGDHTDPAALALAAIFQALSVGSRLTLHIESGGLAGPEPSHTSFSLHAGEVSDPASEEVEEDFSEVEEDFFEEEDFPLSPTPPVTRTPSPEPFSDSELLPALASAPPVAAPVPVAATAAAPALAAVPTPAAPVPAPAPPPVPTPVAVPAPAPAPAPVPTPVAVPAPVPMPAPVTGLALASVSTPVAAPAPAPPPAPPAVPALPPVPAPALAPPLAPPAPAPVPAFSSLPTRWYTITVGRRVGIFTDWAIVGPLVLGVSGAVFKRHPSRALAELAFEEALRMEAVRVI